MGTSSVILGNTRRMLMIEYLRMSKGRANLRDIVEYIAGIEGDTNKKHRKSIYVSLLQTHIPKLEREGVIAFKQGVITLVNLPEDVTVYMETVKKNDISWSSFYIGLSLIFLLIGLYVRNSHLVLASLVYTAVGFIHRQKVKRIFG